MKRNLFILLSVLFSLTYWACRKNNNPEIISKIQDPFVATAIDYLKPKINDADFAKLDFNSVKLLKEDQKTTGVIICSKDKQDLTSVIIGEKDNIIIGNWLMIEEKGSINEGIIHTESFDGDLKNDVTYVDNKVVKLVKTDHGIIKTTLINYPNKNEFGDSSAKSNYIGPGIQASEGHNDPPPTYLPLPNIIVSINNYPTTFHSLFYYYNNNSNYYYNYNTILPNTGGGGGGGTSFNTQPYSPTTFIFTSKPGVDLNALLRCFGNIPNSGATFSVKLCSDLPVNSDPSKLITGLTPGHTFITLTKSNASSSISQSFGFYPQSGSKSVFDVATTSKIVDDGSHEYNASIVMNNISALDFNTVQNMALNLAALMQYDLDDYNCTDYALQVFNSIRPSNSITFYDWIGQYSAIDYGHTPNGLYKVLNDMKNAGNSSVQVGVYNAPTGNGTCN